MWWWWWVYQAVQALMVDPAADRNWPVGQPTHTEAPVLSMYFPAEQATHDVEADTPVVARYVPVTQPTHVVAPVTDWYWPAAQPTQTVAPMTV